MITRTSASILFALTTATAALACGLAGPKDAGAVQVSRAEILIVHAGATELLVVQERYEIPNATKGPDALALTFPVGGAPTGDDCTVADDALFTDLASLGTEKPATEKPEKGVGKFEAVSIPGKGPAGVTALQGWLERNGFSKYDDRVELGSYRGAGASYLVAKITDEKLPAKGVLHPYGVRFSVQQPRLPLKLLSHAGPCELRVTILTQKAIDPALAGKSGLRPDSKRAATVEAEKLPKSLNDLLATKPAAGLLDDLKKGKVALLVLEAKLNAEAKESKVETWFQDPALPEKR